MEELLKNMDPEKQECLINASIDEFGENGFKKASTNSIVRKAGISKGLLFHYFDTKESLFKYMEGYVINLVIETIEAEMDWDDSDFFNRILQIAVIKGRLTYRYPKIFEFFTSILTGKSLDDINAYREDIAPGLMQKIYTHNIDYSRFRPGIDMEKTMKIINWVIEKYSLELLDEMQAKKQEFDYMKIVDEFQGYMDLLKEAFYK